MLNEWYNKLCSRTLKNKPDLYSFHYNTNIYMIDYKPDPWECWGRAVRILPPVLLQVSPRSSMWYPVDTSVLFSVQIAIKRIRVVHLFHEHSPYTSCVCKLGSEETRQHKSKKHNIDCEKSCRIWDICVGVGKIAEFTHGVPVGHCQGLE